ncbi:hypothetical protein LINPERPRIM_LOCUS3875, partial [Linum perenne]
CSVKPALPVILPLPRARSIHCSVKPALRIALYSRNHAISVFTKTAWPNSKLGTGGPETSQPKPNHLSMSNVP